MTGSVRIVGAGGFTASPPGTTHWVEHLRSANLSVGTYSVGAGGTDDQVPHSEDEVYVVTAGRAGLWTPSGAIELESGDAVFVPARQPHRFVDVSEDFAVLVVFAPPESGP